MSPEPDKNGVDDLLEKHERFGVWCAALGSMGAGVWFWFGWAGVAEEVAVHREVGAGMGALGFLVLLALTLRGQAGYRVRSLLRFVICLGVGGLCSVWAWDRLQDVRDLHADGVHANVSVLDSHWGHKGEEFTLRTWVEVEGEKVEVATERRVDRGDTLKVFYVPGRPDLVLDGEVEHGWIALTRAVAAPWMLVVIGLAFPGMVVIVLMSLWGVLRGAPAGSDPNLDR